MAARNFKALRAFRLAPGARIRHQNACPYALATRGHMDTLIKSFLEATDREAVRPTVVVRRIDIAIVVEVQVVRAVAVWSN